MTRRFLIPTVPLAADSDGYRPALIFRDRRLLLPAHLRALRRRIFLPKHRDFPRKLGRNHRAGRLAHPSDLQRILRPADRNRSARQTRRPATSDAADHQSPDHRFPPAGVVFR